MCVRPPAGRLAPVCFSSRGSPWPGAGNRSVAPLKPPEPHGNRPCLNWSCNVLRQDHAGSSSHNHANENFAFTGLIPGKIWCELPGYSANAWQDLAKFNHKFLPGTLCHQDDTVSPGRPQVKIWNGSCKIITGHVGLYRTRNYVGQLWDNLARSF